MKGVGKQATEKRISFSLTRLTGVVFCLSKSSEENTGDFASFVRMSGLLFS